MGHLLQSTCFWIYLGNIYFISVETACKMCTKEVLLEWKEHSHPFLKIKLLKQGDSVTNIIQFSITESDTKSKNGSKWYKDW